eukprot:Clim_evm17s119 gene=Clim_evmTU17s119
MPQAELSRVYLAPDWDGEEVTAQDVVHMPHTAEGEMLTHTSVVTTAGVHNGLPRSGSAPSLHNVHEVIARERENAMHLPMLRRTRSSTMDRIDPTDYTYMGSTARRFLVLGINLIDPRIYGLEVDSDESSEEDLSDHERAAGVRRESFTEQELNERAPLLAAHRPPPEEMAKARKHLKVQRLKHGSGIGRTIFALIKAFIGSGVLFIPKGYSSAGLLIGTVLLLVCGWMTWYGAQLLLMTRQEMGRNGIIVNTYGDMADKLYGKHGRAAVDVAVFFSQFGFCCAYIVFIAKNLRDAFGVITDCGLYMNEWVYMVALMPVLVPLTWVRRLKYFALTNMIANVVIFSTLAYILAEDAVILSVRGPGPNVALSQWDTALVMLGTAIFSFEGIAMIVPIELAMKEPEKLPDLFTKIMYLIVAILVVFGGINYLTYGDQTESIITLNLGGVPALIIQLSYCLAILFTFPLMAFPACRVIERLVYPNDDRKSLRKKWTKNTIRAGIVTAAVLVGIVGAARVDNFVSLIGAVACTPLAFIFPPMFYSRTLQTDVPWSKRYGPNLVLAFGIFAMIFSTATSVHDWITAKADEDQSYCAQKGDMTPFDAFRYLYEVNNGTRY